MIAEANNLHKTYIYKHSDIRMAFLSVNTAVYLKELRVVMMDTRNDEPMQGFYPLAHVLEADQRELGKLRREHPHKVQ